MKLIALLSCLVTFSVVSTASAIVLNGQVEAGAVIRDGGGDIFDDWGRLAVNGTFFRGAVTGSDPI